MLEQYKGELAALLAAFLWAAASTVYSRLGAMIPPLELNLLKGVVAIAYLILTLAIQGEWLPELNWVAIAFLLTSGIFGIGIGDTSTRSATDAIIKNIDFSLSSIAGANFLTGNTNADGLVRYFINPIGNRMGN